MIASRRIALGLAAALQLSRGATVCAATPPAADLRIALDVKQGTVWAAECLALPRPSPDCNRRAMQAGKPVGVLEAGRFTVLLLDSRVLAGLCAAPLPPSQPLPVLVQGLVHRQGLAMTVFQVSANCGSGYQVVDLPYSGVSIPGAEGGDE